MIQVTKATSQAVSDLFHLAWNHESMEGDDHQKRRLAQFASDNGLTHLLPDEAHTVMHDHFIPHNHDGVKNGDDGYHNHPIVKAFNPIAKNGMIVKSWEVDDKAYTEGWLATPNRDLEKDETEPEAFVPAMDSYFERRAPLSIEHEGKSLPIGHLQKAAVVRDGKVIKSAVHPTDPAEFEYFPESGTGVWVRAVANEPLGVNAIRKGNVGGYSFIANARKMERIPGGRYRYLEFDPWIESTIAAYPINPQAVIAVAKAFGLKEETPMSDQMTLEELLRLAAEKVNQEDAQAKKAQPLTAEGLGSVLAEFKVSLLQEIDGKVQETVQKALPDPQRNPGVGRKGTVLGNEDPREADPLKYIIAKAADPDEMTQADKELHWGITFAALTQGMAE